MLALVSLDGSGYTNIVRLDLPLRQLFSNAATASEVREWFVEIINILNMGSAEFIKVTLAFDAKSFIIRPDGSYEPI